MRIRTKELLRKLAPLGQSIYNKVHHADILMKEEWRRLAWKRDVLAACDNVDVLFPEGEKGANWTDPRIVQFPKKWRVPKQVFGQQWERYICYHVIRQGKRWKIVRIKKGPKVVHLTLRKGKKA